MKTILTIGFLVNAALVAWIREPSRWRRSDRTVVAAASSSLDRALVLAAFVTMVPLPFTYLFTHLLDRADFRLPPALGWTGIAIISCGTWLLWLAHRDLGRHWSRRLEIGADHELITGGIYGRIRHPMYAAMFVSGLGQPLVLQNWLAGPGLLVVSLLFVALRVPREEALLTQRFGESYREYARRTGRVVPRLRGS